MASTAPFLHMGSGGSQTDAVTGCDGQGEAATDTGCDGTSAHACSTHPFPQGWSVQ